MIPLSELLDDRIIDLTLSKGRKRAIISRLVELAVTGDAVSDPVALERELLEREQDSSSAIGGSIAIPHKLSSHITRRVLGFARCSEGTAFDAPDREPVRLFFLLLAPETAVTEHLRILSRLARFLHDAEFRTALLSAANASDVRRAFEAKERE